MEYATHYLVISLLVLIASDLAAISSAIRRATKRKSLRRIDPRSRNAVFARSFIVFPC